MVGPISFGYQVAGFGGGVADPAYLGNTESADLLWHLKKYEFGTSNATVSSGFNVNGVTLAMEGLKVVGDTTISSSTNVGSGTADSLGTAVRYEGDLTVNASQTLSVSARKRGLYLFIDGDLSVSGSISMVARGADGQSEQAVQINNGSGLYKVAGTTTIATIGSAAGGASGNAGTNGSNTTTALTAGGGGAGGNDCSAGGAGAIGSSFTGGSGGGGHGRSNYGCGGSGSGAGTLGNKGGNGGNGHNADWSQSTGGSGGTGNPGGDKGVGYQNAKADGLDGTVGTGGLLVIYATGDITVNSGGSITTAGTTGATGNQTCSNGASNCDAGGGGASGGGILVAACAGTYTNNGTVTTAGGTGGSAGSAASNSGGRNGGSGGLLASGGY